MGKIIKGGSECSFCMRNLRTNIYSLSSASCQNSSINEKLMSFINPTDYKSLNDSALFPDPKICKSCFNLVNNIHSNALKIESLTGTRINFHFESGSTVDGEPTEKQPVLEEENGSNKKQNKNKSLLPNNEYLSGMVEDGNLVGSQTETAAEIKTCLLPQKTNQECQKISEVQDSGEETDNYYEADELHDVNMIRNEDYGPSASTHQSWSVKHRSTQLSTQVPKLSLKLIKSDVINAVRNDAKTIENGNLADVTVQSFKKDAGKLEGFKEKRMITRNQLSVQKCQNNNANSPEVSLPVKSLERKGLKREKEHQLSEKTKLPHICPYTDCFKAFIRPQDLKTHITLHTGEKPFKCEVFGCSKEYRLRNQYNIHIRTHTGERPYKCQHKGCDRAFKRLKSLRLHETTHSSEQPFCCDECGKRFKHIHYFKLHKKCHKRALESTQPPDKSIPCEVCGKMFPARLNVKRHINLVHKGIKPKRPSDQLFVCEVNGCNRKFRWKSCMVRHKALKHRKENYKHKGQLVKYTCEVGDCQKEFNRRRLLREHMASAHGKGTESGGPKTFKELLCPDCGMAVIKIQMNRHRDTYHSPGSMFNAEERGDFVCMTELCGMKFGNADNLRAHIPTHVENPPYTCLKTNCHKTFLLKKNLDLHMMIHDNIKQFQCKEDGCGKGFITQLCLMRHSREHNDGLYICPVELCDARFRNMNNAGSHLATHRGEDPYVCGLCGAVFATYNVWARHKKRHSLIPVERNHKCSQCGKAFKLKSDLKRHQPVHWEEKPYSCEICGMVYASKTGYKCHMLTHEEKKYICKFEGCGKSFALPLSFKRHQTVHEKSTKLCSSCGKILKVNLKKHKCASLKQSFGDEKQIHFDVQGQAPQQSKNVHHSPLQMPPSIMPSVGFQEHDQLLQMPQSQRQHHLQPLHVHQDGQGMSAQLVLQQMLNQQQSIQQQQQQQQQQQYNQKQHQQQQERHHHSLLPFQSKLQLSLQQIQSIAMSHELGVTTTAAAATDTDAGRILGNADVDTRQANMINIPASNICVSNIPVGAANLQPNLSFPPLPSSVTSIPLNSFPLSSAPVTSLSLTPSTVPLMPLNSQPMPFFNMPPVSNTFSNTSIPVTTSPQENVITATTELPTIISPQRLTQSLRTVLNTMGSDYY